MVRLVSAKHTQILRDQLVIVQDVAGRPSEHASSGVEDYCMIRNVKRELAILFDQNDRLPFFLQAPDGATDLCDDQRRQALRGFIE
jgi:hypothetical protein